MTNWQKEYQTLIVAIMSIIQRHKEETNATDDFYLGVLASISAATQMATAVRDLESTHKTGRDAPISYIG